jgi:O-antigen/teichoic acid export membrane protein
VSFVVYGSLFLIAPAFLRTHYRPIIWTTYLTLTGIAAIIGLGRVWRLTRASHDQKRPTFVLPHGFWPYTLSLQQQSMISMVAGRLDYVVLLNLGGLAVLGQYVAVMTIAEMLRMITGYFLDPLLPALTNVLATGNRAGAARVFETTLRLVFAVVGGATYILIFFVGPIIKVMGPEYVALRPLFIIMISCAGIWAPGSAGNVLLTSLGKQQRAVWIMIGQTGLFVGTLVLVYERWQLLGAIVAYGSALLVSGILMLALAGYRTGVQISFVRTYLIFCLTTGIAASASVVWKSFGPVEAATASISALGLFLWGAGYTIAECKSMVRYYIPHDLFDRWLGSERIIAEQPSTPL